MKDTKDDLVLYRLAKARETLDDARILANSKRWNPCVQGSVKILLIGDFSF